MTTRNALSISLLTVAAVVASACATTQPEPTKPAFADYFKKPEPVKEPTKEVEVAQEAPLAPQPIYFPFDSSTLTEAAKAELATLGTAMRANRNAQVTISGHADDRGTEEYNLTLGDRRANAARNYLTGLGVERARISVVSYGEERPVATGESEQAWAKNRRDEFDLRTQVASND